MIQYGPNIQHQTQVGNTTAGLPISQFLVFNSMNHANTVGSCGLVRHNHDRDTPLPIYTALKIHDVTQKNKTR